MVRATVEIPYSYGGDDFKFVAPGKQNGAALKAAVKKAYPTLPEFRLLPADHHHPRIGSIEDLEGPGALSDLLSQGYAFLSDGKEVEMDQNYFVKFRR